MYETGSFMLMNIGTCKKELLTTIAGDKVARHTMRWKEVSPSRWAFSAIRCRRMDETDVKIVIAPGQGAHLVLPKAFLPGDSAIMVAQLWDWRVLFCRPLARLCCGRHNGYRGGSR